MRGAFVHVAMMWSMFSVGIATRRERPMSHASSPRFSRVTRQVARCAWWDLKKTGGVQQFACFTFLRCAVHSAALMRSQHGDAQLRIFLCRRFALIFCPYTPADVADHPQMSEEGFKGFRRWCLLVEKSVGRRMSAEHSRARV